MFTRLQRLRGRAFQTSLRWYSNVEFPFAREFLVFTELGKNLGRSTGKRDWNGAVFQRFDSPWTILFLFRMRVNFIFTGEFNSLSPSFLCFFLFFYLFSVLFSSRLFFLYMAFYRFRLIRKIRPFLHGIEFAFAVLRPINRPHSP